MWQKYIANKEIYNEPFCALERKELKHKSNTAK